MWFEPAVVVLFSILFSVIHADDVFTSPPGNGIKASLGSTVLVEWSTNWNEDALVSLYFWQQSEAGDWLSSTLIYNETDPGNFLWTVDVVDNMPVNEIGHFELSLGAGSGHGFNSGPLFLVNNTATTNAIPSSSSISIESKSSTTIFLTSTAQFTTSITTTPSATSSTTAATNKVGSQTATKVGLGVGLGLGIPLLLLVAGVAVFMYRINRGHQEYRTRPIITISRKRVIRKQGSEKMIWEKPELPGDNTYEKMQGDHLFPHHELPG